MTFWIVTALLALAVAALLALALLRGRRQEAPAAAYDLRVYRQQLRDVDKDLARGVINEGDADRIRTEVSRRILAADSQLQREQDGGGQPRRLSLAAALGIGAVIVAGAMGLYRSLGAPGYGDFSRQTRIAIAEQRAAARPGQAEAESRVPPMPAPEASAEYQALVQQLRDTAGKRADDPRGQELLAQHEAALGNFKAAYEAKQKFIDLSGDTASAQDYADLGELMILAAGGYVSPEAQEALQQALNRDHANGPARYYWGLLQGQIGRPDRGYRIWADTLAAGPAGAPWINGIEAQIEDMALSAGVEYRPITPRAAPPALPGPGADDIAAAQEMSGADREEMIRGMVSRLSDRLATEGGSPEEWARLIGALGVLGEAEQAGAIYGEAKQAFAGNTEALARISSAAKQAGLEE